MVAADGGGFWGLWGFGSPLGKLIRAVVVVECQVKSSQVYTPQYAKKHKAIEPNDSENFAFWALGR